MRKMLLCVIAAAIMAGCSTTQTPRSQCFAAAGSFEVVQIGLEAAVQSPLIAASAKDTIKVVSQKGTEASAGCMRAAEAGDGDRVAFLVATMAEAARMGREMALSELKKEAADGQ